LAIVNADVSRDELGLLMAGVTGEGKKSA